MNAPVYLIDDEKSEMIVNSIVSTPAHLKKALKFDEQKKMLFIDDEKRIIKGVVLSADQPIYRRDEQGEYYVVFTEKAIRSIADKYFKSNKYSLLNIEHDGNDSDKYGYLIESYFVNEDTTFNGQPLKKGSWVASYKITDDKLWSEIKAGKFNGFSVEVMADLKRVNFQKQIKMSKKKTIIEKLASLLSDAENFAEIQTVDGQTLQYDGELAEGVLINIVAADGTETLAPEGDYVVEIDGVKKTIKVDAEGKVVSITEAAPEVPSANETMEKMAQVLEKYSEKVAQLEKEIADLKKANSKFNKTPKTPNGNGGNINWDKLKF